MPTTRARDATLQANEDAAEVRQQAGQRPRPRRRVTPPRRPTDRQETPLRRTHRVADRRDEAVSPANLARRHPEFDAACPLISRKRVRDFLQGAEGAGIDVLAQFPDFSTPLPNPATFVACHQAIAVLMVGYPALASDAAHEGKGSRRSIAGESAVV